jgi:hypothetical protein
MCPIRASIVDSGLLILSRVSEFLEVASKLKKTFSTLFVCGDRIPQEIGHHAIAAYAPRTAILSILSAISA